MIAQILYKYTYNVKKYFSLSNITTITTFDHCIKYNYVIIVCDISNLCTHIIVYSN